MLYSRNSLEGRGYVGRKSHYKIDVKLLQVQFHVLIFIVYCTDSRE
jgi:hypothetical protein